jgi:hypothetical protein
MVTLRPAIRDLWLCVGLAMLPGAAHRACADATPAPSAIRPLSESEMREVKGGDWWQASKCSSSLGEDPTRCPGAVPECALSDGTHCIHKEPYQYWVCRTGYPGFTCPMFNMGPCERQRICDSDGGQCNYGSGTPANWWCYNSQAECGNWGNTGTLPENCGYRVEPLP